MNRFCLSIIVGAGLIVLAHPASAQSPAAKSKTPPNNAASVDKSQAKIEAERIAKERRREARLLLISLAGDARTFRDQKLRARSLARIADALWSVDSEQGRTFFGYAWEAASTADQSQEPYNLGEEPPNLRGEILRLVSRRDRLLAEEFLQKLKADQREIKTQPTGSNLWTLSDAKEKRLNLARNLLNTGDINGALQFADPVLGGVTVSTVDFLTQLREKDPAAADQRYAAMLANTVGNMLADANTISLLSSYVFTPYMYVTFNTQGGADSSLRQNPIPAPSVSQQLRRAFFQTAGGVLLRPQLSPEQDRSSAGIVGKYMVVKRLMPLFEQYAPEEITDAIRAQFEVLNSLVSVDVRQREHEMVQKGISPEKSLADQERPLLDQIERARTSDERDELYLKLALLALRKDNMKARDYVSKIEASWFRKQAQAWVDASLAFSAIKEKKVETALELARIGELSHIQRVWILAQAAKLLAKTDHDKALSLLDEAIAEVRRIEVADLDRPRGLLAIANALKLIEPSRAWDAVFDAVKAANSTEGFTGEGGGLTLHLNSKSQISTRTEGVADFDLEGIFGKLASDDYHRAVQMARAFQEEAPRVNATIAIARSVLNEKIAPVPTPKPATKD